MSNSTIKSATAIKKGQRHINTARTIPEIFDVVRAAETQEEKVQLLKAYDSKGLRFVVNGLYNVDWSDMKVPKVKFNHLPPEICNTNIGRSVSRLEAAYQFRVDKPEVTRRNLTRILEEVSKEEAELLVDMFKGKKVDGISKAIFKRAFPDFFRSGEEDSPS